MRQRFCSRFFNVLVQKISFMLIRFWEKKLQSIIFLLLSITTTYSWIKSEKGVQFWVMEIITIYIKFMCHCSEFYLSVRKVRRFAIKYLHTSSSFSFCFVNFMFMIYAVHSCDERELSSLRSILVNEFLLLSLIDVFPFFGSLTCWVTKIFTIRLETCWFPLHRMISYQTRHVLLMRHNMRPIPTSLFAFF